VRPSIIVAAINDPVPGWVEGFNGPIGKANCSQMVNYEVILGVISAVGRGIVKNFVCDGSLRSDLIPVDVVANMVLAATVSKARKQWDRHGVPVYNCVSGCDAPLFWQDVFEHGLRNLQTRPDEEALRYPTVAIRESQTVAKFCKFWQQWLPLALADLCRMLSGAKGRYLRLNAKLNEGEKVVSFFANNEWSWDNANAKELMHELPMLDRQMLSFDLQNLDWRAYFENFIMGIRTYNLKQSPTTLAKSRRRIAILQLAEYVIKLLIFAPPAIWLALNRRRVQSSLHLLAISAMSTLTARGTIAK